MLGPSWLTCRGIGGAVAERLPVIHLVGSPRSNLQHKDALVHHTCNLPDQYKLFSQMSRPISAETCVLIDIPDSDPTALTDAIDSAITTCIVESRPVYIDVPLDYNHKEVSSAKLATPLVRVILMLGSINEFQNAVGEVSLTPAQIRHSQEPCNDRAQTPRPSCRPAV